MHVGQVCDVCDGRSARAARWCQWCGAALRDLEDFETPRTEGSTDECPCCGSPAAEVSWQTAPHQSVCSADGCPVNTWDSSTTSGVVKLTDRWDARLEQSDLRHRALEAWGTTAQLNKAAEECAELAASLNRDLNGQQDRAKLLGEFIDATIMLWQVELMFSEEALEAALDEALDDLVDRLEVHG